MALYRLPKKLVYFKNFDIIMTNAFSVYWVMTFSSTQRGLENFLSAKFLWTECNLLSS